MSKVTVKYKDEVITDLPNGGACVLRTAGKYLDGNISVEYVPRHRSYEITFASDVSQSGAPLYLIDFEDEVLEHINDIAMQVSLYRTSVPERDSIVYMVFCGNTQLTYQYNISTGASYGVSASTPRHVKPTFYPVNNTDSVRVYGNGCSFCVIDKKYYVLVTSDMILDGTYILTFSW